LGHALKRLTGVAVPYDAWTPQSLPDHLRMTVRVVDDSGTVLATGKDVEALQRDLAPAVQETISFASRSLERHGLTEFPAEGVPRVVEEIHGEHVVQGWPALVDTGDAVDLRVCVTRAEQAVAMRDGVRRLLHLDVPAPVRYVVGVLSMREKLALGHTPHGSVPALIDDAFGAVLDAAVTRASTAAAARSGGQSRAGSSPRPGGWGGLRDPVEGFEDGLPWERSAYDAIVADVRDRAGDELLRTVRQAAAVLELATEARVQLGAVTSPKLLGMTYDVTAQLDALLPDGFITLAGAERLPDLQRYLRAVLRRLETAPQDTERDAARQATIEAATADYEATLEVLHPAERDLDATRNVRWMLEELRVNLFAQNLGTKHPVSDTRIRKALDALLTHVTT
jgi:ATP-dependent helicase HrpA